MFGYIMPDKPELKIKEYEYFRAYYCGVCKSMGRSFGPLARFTLNYDSVFLALFLSSLHGERPTLKKEVCIANPVKKKWIAKDSNFIDLAADISAILTYYKLKDNWQDEKSIPSLAAGAVFHPGWKRAAKRRPEVDNAVASMMKEQSRLEGQNCSSMDAAAEPSANMLKQILQIAYQGDDKSTLRILEWVGYNIGKWIYLIDAYDDIEKDIKSGSYNPLLLQYKYSSGERIIDFKEKIKEEVGFNLTHTLGQLASSMELLKLNNKGIIDNILYLGIYNKNQSILNKHLGNCQGNCENKITKGVV